MGFFFVGVGAGITGEGQGHADRDAAQGHRDIDRQVQTQSRAQVQGQVAKACHHMRHSTGTKTGTGHMSRDWLPKHVIIWDTAQGQRQGQDTGAGTGCQSMSSYDIFNISITISISISIYNLQQGHTDRDRGTVSKGQGRGHWDRDRDRLPMHAIMSSCRVLKHCYDIDTTWLPWRFTSSACHHVIMSRIEALLWHWHHMIAMTFHIIGQSMSCSAACLGNGTASVIIWLYSIKDSLLYESFLFRHFFEISEMNDIYAWCPCINPLASERCRSNFICVIQTQFHEFIFWEIPVKLVLGS